MQLSEKLAHFKPSVILVDGSSYLFRAFYGLPASLTAPDGMQTNAIHGVLNMLDSLKTAHPETQIIVVFDAKGKTFRHDMYSEYKANRASMPEELATQIQPLHTIIKALGYPLVIHPGVEADDVIGTLALAHQGNTLISTGDKDMAQLVSDNVALINTMSNEFLDRDGVYEKFGVYPERIRDYLALMGDTSDNIPGVPKVGPKTAVKWLAEYDSLDNVMANAEQFGGKIGENLRASLDILPLSYQLVTIDTAVETVAVENCRQQDVDEAELVGLYKQYGLRQRLKKLADQSGIDVASVATDAAAGTGRSDTAPIIDMPPITDEHYSIISSTDGLDQWLAAMKTAPLVAFDLETDSLDVLSARIVGLSVCMEVGHAAYIPLQHDYLDAPAQLDIEATLAALKPLLESASILKVGHNLKYDYQVLRRYDITLRGIRHDTMLASYIVDSVAGRHDMDSCAERVLGHSTIHYEDIAGKGKKQLTFNQIDVPTAAKYAAEDVDITLRLHHSLTPQMTQRMRDVYQQIEIPLVTILAEIELGGVNIDSASLHVQTTELEALSSEIQKRIYEITGEEFNLSSPKQIQEIFFDPEKLNLPIIKKTPKGQPSTAEDVLSELAHEHEVPRMLLDYRSMNKLVSTYTKKLPEQVHTNTGRIHTSYHQAVAATGRLSSSDPNLQNIPIRSEQGRKIRTAFVAPDGYTIVAADYSQIELRILAHLSEDERLLTAFKQNLDIHSATAAEIFAVDLEQVTSDHRRKAKAVNFGLVYGMSAFGLAKQLGISRGDAQQYVDKYFARYPGVSDYMQRMREYAHEHEFVETLFGRRLYLPEINAKNKMRQSYAERTAINAPMQGTAADIIKRAMIGVNDWLKEADNGVQMVMQVHDELVFEVPTEKLDDICAEIKTCMQNAAVLDVPLIVDVGTGSNWDEAH